MSNMPEKAKRMTTMTAVYMYLDNYYEHGTVHELEKALVKLEAELKRVKENRDAEEFDV